MTVVRQDIRRILLAGDPVPWDVAEGGALELVQEDAPYGRRCRLMRQPYKLTRYWPNGYPQVKWAFYEDVTIVEDDRKSR